MQTILDRLNDVFRQVFDDEELEVSPTTTAADIEGWDSLMHVRLVLSVEKAFQMRFSSTEVAALKKVGDLVDLIVSKGTS
jgi:acyl carrier protein